MRRNITEEGHSSLKCGNGNRDIKPSVSITPPSVGKQCLSFRKRGIGDDSDSMHLTANTPYTRAMESSI